MAISLIMVWQKALTTTSNTVEHKFDFHIISQHKEHFWLHKIYRIFISISSFTSFQTKGINRFETPSFRCKNCALKYKIQRHTNLLYWHISKREKMVIFTACIVNIFHGKFSQKYKYNLFFKKVLKNCKSFFTKKVFLMFFSFWKMKMQGKLKLFNDGWLLK